MSQEKRLKAYAERCDKMEKLIRLNVAVDEVLHKELRIAVAECNTTIGKFVKEAIAEKIEREKHKN